MRKTAKRAREAAPRVLVAHAEDAARIARPVMNVEQETFVVLLLNIRNVMIGAPVVVAMGTAHGVEVHPRDVFRAAIRDNAAGIVVLHNHPSGDPTPSVEDIALTKRLRAVGDVVGVPVVDHVVVTTDNHWSITLDGAVS